MPKINVLPKSVAELIAAGEVVERPLSVVKELIENSIDAHADTITVEIKNGGVKYIRVTDNGCGIAREDVRTAFISHATSKIAEPSDLDHIFTLGFRGEALPSIAAVSRLSLLTKTEEADVGAAFEIDGGKEISLDEAGCPTGTTVVVRNLFYNTPARLKFLKKDVTEGNYVSDIVTKTALSHPEIRFIFIRDDKPVLRTPGSGDLFETIFAVFGREVSDALISCDYSYEGIEISGYISKPLNNRPNRNMQYFFVNGRSVRIPAAAPALDNAYKNSIMVGKFPMCFLNIKLDASKTDVNVHPSKTEIRFSEDGKLFEAIFYAARSALAKGDRDRPGIKLKDIDLLKKAEPEVSQLKFVQPFPHNTKDPVVRKTVAPPPAFLPKKDASDHTYDRLIDIPYTEPDAKAVSDQNEASAMLGLAKETPAPKRVFEFRDGSSLQKGESALEASNRSTEDCAVPWETKAEDVIVHSKTSEVHSPVKAAFSADEEAVIAEENDAPASVRVIGEIFRTYIIAEQGNKMLLIDKHAAHERILFNRISKAAEDETVPSQLLLTPLSVSLSGSEYAAILENQTVLEKAGFEVEDFGGGTILVRSCPLLLANEDLRSVISEIAGEFAGGNLQPEPEKLSWIFHSAACRAAVKAGDSLAPEQMQHFAEQLLNDPDVRYCPHGRPVLYELTQYELEKQFGRVT